MVIFTYEEISGGRVAGKRPISTSTIKNYPITSTTIVIRGQGTVAVSRYIDQVAIFNVLMIQLLLIYFEMIFFL